MDSRLADYLDDFTRRDWQTLAPDDVDDPVRVAVVGLGWFAREWALPGISRSEFTDATVVTDVDAEAVDAVAADRDVRGVTPGEFRNGDAAADYDAVYVATPNATHLEYVEAAAAQGKPVLCEKPLEATPERAERLVAACDDAGVPLVVGYRMQTDPAARRLRDLLDAGFAGDVVHVHATMSQTMLSEPVAARPRPLGRVCADGHRDLPAEYHPVRTRLRPGARVGTHPSRTRRVRRRRRARDLPTGVPRRRRRDV